jgi:hypothetical protein
MSAEQVYHYRAKPMTLVWGALFFGTLGVFMLHEATTNTRGLLIDRFIRLDPDEATTFYFIIAVLGLLFVPAAIFSLFISLTKKTVLTLGPSSITVPLGIRRQERTIAYGDIKSIQHQKVRSQEFLKVTPRSGKVISISASLLPSKSEFATVRGELTARAKAAQGR